MVWGSESSRLKAEADGYRAAPSREAFFAESDVLSVHLRLCEGTRGSITPEDLGQMKPTALFVNTSRAELVVENALVSALNRGRPGMAAIDVFESEPTRCCGWRTRSARRISAMSSRTAMSCTSRRPSTTC
jgi:D-3-phosphoglycerate dehydrogenase